MPVTTKKVTGILFCEYSYTIFAQSNKLNAMEVVFEYYQELETIHRDINTHAVFTVEANVEGDEVQVLSIKLRTVGFCTYNHSLRVPAEDSYNVQDNLMMGLFREKARDEALRQERIIAQTNKENQEHGNPTHPAHAG